MTCQGYAGEGGDYQERGGLEMYHRPRLQEHGAKISTSMRIFGCQAQERKESERG